MNDTLRVVQWTTGRVGAAAVRGVVSHPRLELVGAFAHSEEKVGVDVGTLSGLPPLGVAATSDVEHLLRLGPDCVMYTPYRPDVDEVARILSSGANVVTSMYMLAGDGYGPGTGATLRAAARAGRSSLYCSGVYPGHTAVVALAASAMCRRIDRLSVLESLDVSGYANERMFRAQGFGLEADNPRASSMVEASCGSFREQVRVLAAALSIDLDAITFSAEIATADRDTDLGFMTLDRGSIAGFLGAVSGMLGGEPVIQCRFVWKLGEAMTPSWPVTKGYVIDIKGDPDVTVRLESPTGHFDGATTTSMACVNAIPAVCAAPPGVVNHMELPLVRGTIARRPRAAPA